MSDYIQEQINRVQQSLDASYEALSRRVARLESIKEHIPVCRPNTKKDQDDFWHWVKRESPFTETGSKEWFLLREAFLAGRSIK